MNTQNVPTRRFGPTDIARIAGALADAELTRTPIAPLTASTPDLSVEDAYAIQQVNVAGKLSAGRTVVGRKVGLTSLAMQQQLGVDQPDYGVITDDMLILAPAVFDAGQLIAPRVEAEFSFRLGQDLSPGVWTLDQLRSAVDAVCLSMEIIDSRIADWKITLPDTIADNASSARLVVGEAIPATPELLDALPDTMLELLRDGDLVGSGEGSAVLGDPLLGALWVVNRLGQLGEQLSAGEIILAGAVHASVALTPGATWTARANGFPPAVITTSA